MSDSVETASPILLLEWWKPIPGYEARYEASNVGTFRRKDGKRMKTTDAGKGYLQIGLRDGVKQKRFMAHRLVHEMFVGPIPDGHEINHIYGNKHDNKASRLEAVTSDRNREHALRIGLAKPEGTQAKLSPEKIQAIRTLRSAGVSRSDLSAMFGIQESGISKVVLRKRWAWVA